jgi:hypothetical protein
MYPAFGKCALGVQDWRASQQIWREIYEMLPQLGQFGMVTTIIKFQMGRAV